MSELFLVRDDDRDELDEVLAAGRATLHLDDEAEPEAVLTAVEAYLDGHEGPLGAEAVGVALVWGEALHRGLGWSWACLVEGQAEAGDGADEDEDEDAPQARYAYAVLAPDRSLWCRPTALMAEAFAARQATAGLEALTSPEVAAAEAPPTLAELYHALRTGVVAAEAGALAEIA